MRPDETELEAVADLLRRRQFWAFGLGGLIWFVGNAALMVLSSVLELHPWWNAVPGVGGLALLAFLAVRRVRAIQLD